jgi:flavorubredoxin
MAAVAEIAEDIFRINLELPESPVTYSFFVIRDEEPALVETSFKSTFPDSLEAVRQVIDPARLRHIIIPHLESDESGALNSFLEVAPQATPVCSPIGVLTQSDYAARPPQPVDDSSVLVLGQHRLRFLTTPYVHQWDSMLAYDETTGTLFSSDLFIQPGTGPALVDEDRTDAMVGLYSRIGILPSRPHLDAALDKIEALQPRTLACHHGSVLGARIDAYITALRDFQITCVDWNPLLMAEPR